MLEDRINKFDGEAPSIDPPDNGGPGASLSSIEEEIADTAVSESMSIDPPDNG